MQRLAASLGLCVVLAAVVLAVVCPASASVLALDSKSKSERWASLVHRTLGRMVEDEV